MKRNAFWACCGIVLAPSLLEAQDRVNWTAGGGLVTASLGSFAPEGYYVNGGARVRVGASFAVRADVLLATHEAGTIAPALRFELVPLRRLPLTLLGGGTAEFRGGSGQVQPTAGLLGSLPGSHGFALGAHVYQFRDTRVTIGVERRFHSRWWRRH